MRIAEPQVGIEKTIFCKGGLASLFGTAGTRDQCRIKWQRRNVFHARSRRIRSHKLSERHATGVGRPSNGSTGTSVSVSFNLALVVSLSTERPLTTAPSLPGPRLRRISRTAPIDAILGLTSRLPLPRCLTSRHCRGLEIRPTCSLERLGSDLPENVELQSPQSDRSGSRLRV